MNRHVVNILSWFIFDRKKRHDFRCKGKNKQHSPVKDDNRAVMNNILSCLSNARLMPLLNTAVGFEKTVLIIETNGVHSILLPTICKYFSDLGYNVHLATTAMNMATDVLSVCDVPQDKFRSFTLSLSDYTNGLFLNMMTRYDYIFLCTGMNGTSFNVAEFYAKNYINRYHRHNILYLEHNIDNFQKYPLLKQYLENEHVFALREYDCQSKVIKELSLTYLGDTVNYPKHEIINFITVGRLKEDVKDYQELVNAVRQLVSKNIKNFYVTIVGQGEPYFKIDESLKQYFKFRGELSYPQLIRELEDSDYILFLLHSHIKEHQRYKDKCVTGSTALMYGALKPALLEEDFAESYDLSDENAVLYQKGALSEAMEKAVLLSSDEYTRMVNKLKILRNEKIDQSVKNLELTLKNI